MSVSICTTNSTSNFPSSLLVRRKRKSSFSFLTMICATIFSVLSVLYSCKMGFGGDRCRGNIINENYGETVTSWVESFSPVTRVSPSLSNPTPSFSPHFQQMLLQANGCDESSNEERRPATSCKTAVVLSVFSKPPGKVFQELSGGATLANKGSTPRFLGLRDLQRWDELKEMVADDDLTVQELRNLFDAAVEDGNNGLDFEGFKTFYRSIDNLFDVDDGDTDEVEQNSSEYNDLEGTKTICDNTKIIEDSDGNSAEGNSIKEDLVSYLGNVQSRPCDSEDGNLNAGERRPWGLGCTDRERRNIVVLIEALVTGTRNSNILGSNNSNTGLPMLAKDLTKHILGAWELSYTSSRTMIINKSLSGFGRSTSDMARNLGLKMTLSGSYYYGKAEFVETFGSSGTNNNDTNSDPVLLEATVNGEWIIETGTRTDYKTGLPSVSLRVEVETIAYGPNKSNAEQWDSLSPIKLVDILYLDEDLMILRGNANVDAIFVYTRHR